MTWAKQEAGRPSVCCVSLWPYDRFQRCGNLSVKFIGWNRDTPHHEYVWVGKLLLPTQGYIPHRVLDPYVQIFDIILQVEKVTAPTQVRTGVLGYTFQRTAC